MCHSIRFRRWVHSSKLPVAADRPNQSCPVFLTTSLRWCAALCAAPGVGGGRSQKVRLEKQLLCCSSFLYSACGEVAAPSGWHSCVCEEERDIMVVKRHPSPGRQHHQPPPPPPQHHTTTTHALAGMDRGMAFSPRANLARRSTPLVITPRRLRSGHHGKRREP